MRRRRATACAARCRTVGLCAMSDWEHGPAPAAQSRCSAGAARARLVRRGRRTAGPGPGDASSSSEETSEESSSRSAGGESPVLRRAGLMSAPAPPGPGLRMSALVSSSETLSSSSKCWFFTLSRRPAPGLVPPRGPDPSGRFRTAAVVGRALQTLHVRNSNSGPVCRYVQVSQSQNCADMVVQGAAAVWPEGKGQRAKNGFRDTEEGSQLRIWPGCSVMVQCLCATHL